LRHEASKAGSASVLAGTCESRATGTVALFELLGNRFRIERSGQTERSVERYRGSEYKIDLLAKRQIEIAAFDDQCEEAVQAIRKGAYTGEIGDGKIFILPLEDSMRIRTGEAGEDSL
jgi:nitrogen regulatory protein PII